MITPNREAQAAAMVRIRERFLVRVREDLVHLEAHRADAALPREELRMTVHRLAGSAGLFGFHALTEAAADLDEKLAAGAGADSAMLDRLIDELKRVLDASPADLPPIPLKAARPH